jgi:hypothetical protein
VTAKSFPCALWAVPFLFGGEVGRTNGNASLVIIIQIVQDAVKCLEPWMLNLLLMGNIRFASLSMVFNGQRKIICLHAAGEMLKTPMKCQTLLVFKDSFSQNTNLKLSANE